MNIAETQNEGLKRAYRLTIPATDIAARVDAAIAEVAPQVRMPGFRPGKVPSNLIRKMHGPALRAEAIKEAVNDGINKLIADNNIRPATQPQIDMTPPADDADLEIGVSMEVLPTIEDVNADGIALEKLVVPADEAAVNEAVERLAKQQRSFEEAPEGHAAGNGDLVVMDYKGTIDGVAFDGGTGTGMEVELGSGRLIPGFEEQLVGVKAGEDRTLNVTFPADYGANELAGKDAQFDVTVTAVKQPKDVAIDDTLATNLGLESLDKLKEILKDQVEAETAGLTRTYMKRKLLDALASRHDFDVPPTMVDAEFDQIWAQLEQEARGDSEATTKLEQEKDEYRRIAERRVRLGLLLSEIGQRNNIQVSQAEMNRLVAQEASRYPGQEAQVQKFFSENAMAAAQLRAPLYEEKVVDFLLGKAEVTEREVTREELQAAIESEDESPLSVGAHGHHDHDHVGHVHGPDCDHDHDHAHDHAPAPKAKKAAKKKASDEVLAADAAEAAAGADIAVTDAVEVPAKAKKAKKAETAEAPAEGEAAAKPKKAKKAAGDAA